MMSGSNRKLWLVCLAPPHQPLSQTIACFGVAFLVLEASVQQSAPLSVTPPTMPGQESCPSLANQTGAHRSEHGVCCLNFKHDLAKKDGILTKLLWDPKNRTCIGMGLPMNFCWSLRNCHRPGPGKICRGRASWKHAREIGF